ncbi:hypothetical protein MMPV_009377 [Pyropia vietnamensis]
MAFVPAAPAALRSSSLHGTSVCAAPPPAVASGRIPLRAAADRARGKAASRGGRSSRKPRAVDAPTFIKDLKGRTLWSIRRATPDDVPAMQRLSGDVALPTALLSSLVEAKSRVCLVAEAPVVVGGESATQTGGGASRAMARPTERKVAVPTADTVAAAAAQGGDSGADASESKTVSSGSKGGSQSQDRVVGAAVVDVSMAVRPGGGGLCKVGNLISVFVDDRLEAAASSDGAAAVSVKKVLGLAALRVMKLAGVELVTTEKKVDSPEVAYLMSLGYTEGERTSKGGKRLVQLSYNLVASSPDPGKKIFD